MMVTTRNDKAFPRLEEDDMEALAALATCETYEAGTHILKFGDKGIDLIVIESGRVDIENPMVPDTDDDRLIITHEAGEFIGDIDLLTRRPIIIDAIATGDGNGGPTRVLRVPGDKIQRLLSTVPSLGEKLIVAIQVRRQELEKKGVLGVRLVGPGGCSDTNRIREFLYKNFVPYTWYDTATERGRLAAEALGPGKIPAVDCGGGKVLRCPPLQTLAHEIGVWHGCPSQHADLIVVGAGPAGLAAAVYAASEGLKTVVLDRLGPGGQAGGSSRIENFIGFPAGLSGTDLATRGVLQMLKFGAQMIAPVRVNSMEAATEPGKPHLLHLDCGATLSAKTVLAATGVAWRRLPARNAERYERAGVYYACTTVEAEMHDKTDVAVVGGGNSAGQAVMFLAEKHRGRTVHLLIRRTLDDGMSDYLAGRIRETANVKLHEHVELSCVNGDRWINSIDIADRQGKFIEALPCGAIFVFIGAEPHADWMPPSVARDEGGYILTGSDVVRAGKWPLADRDPCPLETSVPGVLVGGDLRAGSTKRVGFAVGDGSLAVTCVHKLRSMMG